MIKLYYICNTGCDDETNGLARISDEDLPKFKEFIENLNKNSTYRCQPRIRLYQIDDSFIREYTDDDEGSPILYLDDKKYVLARQMCTYSPDDGIEYVEGVELII